MGARIGVICEGSHDFAVLKAFIKRVCDDGNVQIDSFECLQPLVSASFSQMSGGGWGRVKGWCEDQGGTYYRAFLDQPLFAQSLVFDFLIIHLDGDVIDYCNSPPLDSVSSQNVSTSGIVSALEDALFKSWLKLRPLDREKLVACIPVRHLEAWLMAGLGLPPGNLEEIDTKEIFGKTHGPRYPARRRDFYLLAAQDAVQKIEIIRSACISYVMFENQLKKAAAIK